ncbi:MAG: type II toxin-antitoxin system YafQ family toxin [Patescibacteria group bacterium]
MAYSIWYTNKFKRQYRKLKKSDPDLFNNLKAIISLLIERKDVPDKNCNHKLVGNFKDCWECHIAPDWLLIYRYRHDILVLELVATGSHDDLF